MNLYLNYLECKSNILCHIFSNYLIFKKTMFGMKYVFFNCLYNFYVKSSYIQEHSMRQNHKST